jgi:hypothetical protein
MQKYKNTKIQNAKMQKYKNAKIQKCKNTKIQKYKMQNKKYIYKNTPMIVLRIE